MVEANSDPAVVTALILRETREAAAARAEQPSPQQTAAPFSAHFAVKRPSAAESSAVAGRREPEAPGATPSGPWNMQLVFAAVLVAVLLAVWVAERRSGRRMKEEGHGR